MSLRTRLSQALHFVRSTLIEAWPAAIFVSACIVVAHGPLRLVDRLDAWALGALSQMVPFAAHQRPMVWVFTIEEPDFITRYRRSTPLDRSELTKDLVTIANQIDAHNKSLGNADSPQTGSIPIGVLNLLVIDLDLSPISDETANDSGQLALNQTLIELAGTSKRPFPIRIVLMRPLDADDGDSGETSRIWMDDLQRKGNGNIVFGDVRFPIENDLSIRYYCDPTSLAAMAYRFAAEGGSRCVDDSLRQMRALCKNAADCDHVISAHKELIDPVKISLRQVRYRSLTDISTDGDADRRVRAAFFGVALGADTHATSIGPQYGVTLNAITFLSLLNPLLAGNQYIGFGIDILFALFFAVVIAFFWGRFFHDAARNPDGEVILAAKWLVFFAGGIVLILLVVLGASTYFLPSGLWFSPLPVAIGMMIDGAVTGPIFEAIHHARQHPPSEETFVLSARRLFCVDVVRRWKDVKRSVALARLSYLAIWLGVVIVALLPH